MPNGTILDGELITPGPDSKPDFEAIMERFSSNKGSQFIQYVVFDIIRYDGKSLTSSSLLTRKQLLLDTLQPTEHVVLTQFVEGFGIEYFNLVKEQGLEGIVSKRKDSTYQINRRSHDWLKVILTIL